MAGEADSAGVRAAVAGFYSALNRMFEGDLEAMLAVWSHREDVTYMGPTGQFEVGWPAVLKDWQGQAAMKLGGRVDPTEVQLFVGSDLAVAVGYEVGENTNAAGQVQRLKLRATSTFRKETGGWKMIGHHTDTLPYLAN